MGTAAALWVAATSTFLIWFYPIFVLASLFAGLVIGRMASRRAPSALALLAAPLGCSMLWLVYVANASADFGSAMLSVGLAQVALLFVPALVWPRRKSETAATQPQYRHFRMRSVFSYVLAWMPAVFTVGGWQLAKWASAHYSCESVVKGLAPCFAGAFNITPLLGFGLFWLQLVAWVCVPLSLWLTIAVYAKHHSAAQARAKPSTQRTTSSDG